MIDHIGLPLPDADQALRLSQAGRAMLKHLKKHPIVGSEAVPGMAPAGAQRDELRVKILRRALGDHEAALRALQEERPVVLRLYRPDLDKDVDYDAATLPRAIAQLKRAITFAGRALA